MFRVAIPTNYAAERRYIIGVLLEEFLGLEYEIEASPRTDVVLMGDDGKQIRLADRLFVTPEAEWLQPSSLPQSPLRRWRVPEPWRNAVSGDAELPIVLGGDPHDARFLVCEPQAIDWQLDLFGAAFLLLTRYEEAVDTRRDARDRYSAQHSLAYREGFLGRPLVNEYVELFAQLLLSLWPTLKFKPRTYRVALSHDVDVPLWGPGRKSWAIARSLAADLWIRRDVQLARQRWRTVWAQRRGCWDHDPNNTFDFIMTLSEEHGLQSAFYFIASLPSYDKQNRYTVDHPWVRQLLARIAQRGHEIGLHGSYDSYLSGERIREERQRLLADTPERAQREVVGGRQHYLRWRNPVTWQAWEDAGLDYDSTLGFADHSGFRCGVCYEYPVFNLLTRQQLRLRERPLVVMEQSLLHYQGLSPDASLAQAVELAAHCRRYRGTMSVLWHNDTLISAQQRRMYRELCCRIL